MGWHSRDGVCFQVSAEFEGPADLQHDGKCPEYGKYADEVLAKQMDPKVLEEIRAIEAKKDFSNPRYMELLIPNYYEKHLCRFPASEWPDPVNRSSNI